jgi:hypothetical protein
LVLTALVCTAAASAGIAYVVATSTSTPEPGLTAALTVLTAYAFVVAGLIAWRRRPHNRIGLLMLVTGSLWFLGGLPASAVGVLFTIGYATGSWAKDRPGHGSVGLSAGPHLVGLA